MTPIERVTITIDVDGVTQGHSHMTHTQRASQEKAHTHMENIMAKRNTSNFVKADPIATAGEYKGKAWEVTASFDTSTDLISVLGSSNRTKFTRGQWNELNESVQDLFDMYEGLATSQDEEAIIELTEVVSEPRPVVQEVVQEVAQEVSRPVAPVVTPDGIVKAMRQLTTVRNLASTSAAALMEGTDPRTMKGKFKRDLATITFIHDTLQGAGLTPPWSVSDCVKSDEKPVPAPKVVETVEKAQAPDMGAVMALLIEMKGEIDEMKASRANALERLAT